MIISKKHFKQEVTRKALEISKNERLSMKLQAQDERIHKLTRKVRFLEAQIDELAAALMEVKKPAGEIRGFYQGRNGDVVITDPDNITRAVPCSLTNTDTDV